MPEQEEKKYTHSGLIKDGYERTEWPQYPGWVTYEPGVATMDWTWTDKRPRVAFISNDATMNNWIEEVSNWKVHFPDIYKWWGDPTQKRILTKYGELLIKSIDPKLIEEEEAALASR